MRRQSDNSQTSTNPTGRESRADNVEREIKAGSRESQARQIGSDSDDNPTQPNNQRRHELSKCEGRPTKNKQMKGTALNSPDFREDRSVLA